MGLMSEIINAELYTYQIIKGKFKGKIVKSWDSNTGILGITPAYCACFDDEGNEYAIFYKDLKRVQGE